MERNSLQTLCETTVDTLSKVKELQTLPGFTEELDLFQERIRDKAFRVAVVGEFSSGKSTFINALLGRDILSHAAQETTAAITKIVNVSPDDPRNGTGIVAFRDGTAAMQLSSLDDLKEYTTAESKTYQVVKQIDTVTVFMPVMESYDEIELIDTPGLNGIADGHREQTMQIVRTAHACIYLIQRRGLSDSDRYFLQQLMQYQKNIVFVQNFIDDLKVSEGETADQKIAEQREFLQNTVFRDHPEVNFDVCGLSALQELAARDQRIKTLYSDSIEELTDEDRKELHIRSRFEDFRKILGDRFQGERLDEIRYGDTAHALLHWVGHLLTRTSGRKERAAEAYRLSSHKVAMDKLDKLEEKVRAAQKENEKSLANLVAGKCDELAREERKSIEADFLEIQAGVFETINSSKTLEDMERFDTVIPARMDNEIRAMLAEHDVNQKAYLHRLYQVLMDRIEEYSGIQSSGLNVKDVSISPMAEGQKSFQKDKDKIERMEADLRAAEEAKKDAEATQAQAVRELQREERNEDDLSYAANQAENDMNRQKRSMGSRPAAKERKESYTVEVERRGGVFGKIFGFFAGPKIETRYRTKRDDSKGKAWDKKMAEIQREGLEKINDLTRQRDEARRRVDWLRSKANESEQKIKKQQEKIESLQAKLKTEKQELEKLKKRAAQEYLSLVKKNTKDQIEKYIQDETGKVSAQINELVERASAELTKWSIQRYREEMDRKIAWIIAAREKASPDLLQEMEQLQGAVQTLEKLEKTLRQNVAA